MNLFEIVIAIIIFLSTINISSSSKNNILSIADFINSENTTWKARHTLPHGLTLDSLRRRLGVKPRHRYKRLAIIDQSSLINDEVEEDPIPESFDAREKWPKCETISAIYDQGQCGSCWAVAAANSFSDRLCVASNQKIYNVSLSAQQLTFCCFRCGEGCNGGYPEDAWDFFHRHGVVTGGYYNSHEGCQPYEIPPSDASNGVELEISPSCVVNKCSNSNYSIPYAKDLHYTKNVYILPVSEKDIQKDILKHGPVEAAFDVYRDFFFYDTGIYQHVRWCPLEGGHAVRIIGWGVEANVKYWICANSWGSDWGEDGTFRILRGTNECLIEDRIISGAPKI